MSVIFFFYIDMNDFSNTVIQITFLPDENAPDNERAAPIAIFNDVINEADEQVFIVQLHLINSTNPSGIDLSIRPASLCKIIDNDSKPNSKHWICFKFVSFLAILDTV